MSDLNLYPNLRKRLQLTRPSSNSNASSQPTATSEPSSSSPMTFGDTYLPSIRPTEASAVASITKPPVVSMPSPNYEDRPGGEGDISAIVLHHTASGSVSSAQNIGRYFQNPDVQVSSHYIIGKNGGIVQSVPDEKRAWHAGTSTFAGRDDVNDFSLGIEIVNAGDNQDPYTDAQYNSLIDLVAWMCETYGISLERITGHRDIALPKGRKIDPSDNFDWERVRQGVQARLNGTLAASPPVTDPEDKATDNLYEGDSGSRVRLLQQDLKQLGYLDEVSGRFEATTDAAVKRFQSDKGLEVDGIVGPQTRAALAQALGIEGAAAEDILERATAATSTRT